MTKDPRFFCQECDQLLIVNPRSTFAVCPNGHGRLKPIGDGRARNNYVRQLNLIRKMQDMPSLIPNGDGTYDLRPAKGGVSRVVLVNQAKLDSEDKTKVFKATLDGKVKKVIPVAA